MVADNLRKGVEHPIEMIVKINFREEYKNSFTKGNRAEFKSSQKLSLSTDLIFRNSKDCIALGVCNWPLVMEQNIG